MPKIGKFHYRAGRSATRISYEGQVFYDAKAKKFCVRFADHEKIFGPRDSIDVPVGIFKTGYHTITEYAVYGETQSEAESRAKKYLDIFVENQETRRDVILFYTSCTRSDEDSRWGTSAWTRQRMEIEYTFAIEVGVGEDNKSYTTPEGGHLSDQHKRFKVIDRTPAAEAFFENLTESFDKLIDQVDHHLNDVEKVKDAIENRSKLIG